MAESPDDPPLTPLQVEERPAVAVEPGTRLGKYELVKRLSVGGMAEIFLARAFGLPGFQKLVVVKRILPQLASKPEFVEMFLNEARLAATLQHPNIVLTHDVCVIDDNYFIVMEYLHGEDVRTILRTAHKAGRRIPLEQVRADRNGAVLRPALRPREGRLRRQAAPHRPLRRLAAATSSSPTKAASSCSTSASRAPPSARTRRAPGGSKASSAT